MERLEELIRVCPSSDAFELNLNKDIPLEKVNIGETVARTKIVSIHSLGNSSVSVFAHGRILFKNMTKKEAVETAKKILEQIGETL